ncbi:hypothetical protein PZA11_007750 [Diplocarpon coronariae]
MPLRRSERLTAPLPPGLTATSSTGLTTNPGPRVKPANSIPTPVASCRPRDSSFFRDLKRDLNCIKKALLGVLDPLLPLLAKRNAILKLAY